MHVSQSPSYILFNAFFDCEPWRPLFQILKPSREEENKKLDSPSNQKIGTDLATWGLLKRLSGVTPCARQPMGKWNRSAAVISYIYNCLVNKLNLTNKKSEIITLPPRKACLLNIFSYPTNLALRIVMCSARWASSTEILQDLKRYKLSWRELHQ